MTPHPLLDRLGGREGLASTVGALYERILDDPDVASYFDDVDLPRLRLHMIDFLLVAVSDELPTWRGQALDDAHRGVGVTNHAFDRVIGHLATVLGEAGADAESIEQVLARIAPLRPLVVGG